MDAVARASGCSISCASATAGVAGRPVEGPWGAGDFPPNWIEVDLGKPYSVGEIRLRLDEGQLVDRTIHRLSVKGPGTGGTYVVVQTFDGVTSNLDQLVYAPPEPLEGIQFVRAEIMLSPSWAAFREVEVIAAE